MSAASSTRSLLVQLGEDTGTPGVDRIRLNRPEVHNAFDDQLIGELRETLTHLRQRQQTRVLVLEAAGKSFSAGADLNWMRRMAGYSHDENQRDARALADMLHQLDAFPAPTIAAVQGAAIGGGVGLVACCDVAVAASRAVFALSEVKLGLIPATISPFVLRAIGARAARRLFLTAERFDAATAMRLQLVHEVVDSGAAPTSGAAKSSATDAAAVGDTLSTRVELLIQELLSGGPVAQAESKRLIADVAGRPIDAAILDETARRIADVRASTEGRNGVSAFLEKRQPGWLSPPSATRTDDSGEAS